MRILRNLLADQIITSDYVLLVINMILPVMMHKSFVRKSDYNVIAILLSKLE